MNLSPTPILSFQRVTKIFGEGATAVRALLDVDLDVEAGEFVAVMGPSGCGKSTLLHLAGALERPTEGQVVFDDTGLHDLSATSIADIRRRDIGYVFQQLNLIPSLTALENVMLPLELDGMSRRKARTAAQASLARMGITGRVDDFPDDFSGGQRQRIAIARATVGTRRLVLADEPTGALDTSNADEVVDLLGSLVAEHGTTVVMVTHEPRFAAAADRVVFLRDGRVVDQTAPVSTGSIA